MIFFLTRENREFTIKLFLETLGREQAGRIRLLSYAQLFRMRSLPVGTYVFADLERLSPEETDIATTVWNALSASGRAVRLLNHPARSFRRFELLRHLHAKGINDFNAYRVTDAEEPSRYPVFVRVEGDHNGSLTPLLQSREELAAAVQALVANGRNRDDKIVVEFLDSKDEQDVYRLYHAFIVGSHIIARGIEQSHHWVNKGDWAHADDAFVAMNERHVDSNPHEDALRPIFEMAGIQYGRMDYAMVDGRPQVFEINTNPYVLEEDELRNPRWRTAASRVCGRLNHAFREIDTPDPPSRAVRLGRRHSRSDVRPTYRLRMAIHRALWSLRLSRYEAGVMAWLRRIEATVRRPGGRT